MAANGKTTETSRVVAALESKAARNGASLAILTIWHGTQMPIRIRVPAK